MDPCGQQEYDKVNDNLWPLETTEAESVDLENTNNLTNQVWVVP